MIGGEPYTLGLFDTAGEKSSARVTVTALDLAEMMLTIKVYQKRQKLKGKSLQASLFIVIRLYLSPWLE